MGGTMSRRVVAVGVAAMALGVWAGVRAGDSTALADAVEAGLAVTFGCILLLALWLWYRAAPGSGDAMVTPGLAVSSGAILVGLLPRIFWPNASWLHLAAWSVSISAMLVMLTVQIRRRRRLRGGPRPV